MTTTLLRLYFSVTCLVGVALSATFFTAPVPEDPAHPGQCYDEVSRIWHPENESWKRGGECLQSTCVVSVGYRDKVKGQKNLEEIAPRVFRRYIKDVDSKQSIFTFPRKIKTTTFKARGEETQFISREGDKPIEPKAFVSEHIISCFYHVDLPSNCREIQSDSRLPYPGCCPHLKCDGEPQGTIQVIG